MMYFFPRDFLKSLNPTIPVPHEEQIGSAIPSPQKEEQHAELLRRYEPICGLLSPKTLLTTLGNLDNGRKHLFITRHLLSLEYSAGLAERRNFAFFNANDGQLFDNKELSLSSLSSESGNVSREHCKLFTLWDEQTDLKQETTYALPKPLEIISKFGAIGSNENPSQLGKQNTVGATYCINLNSEGASKYVDQCTGGENLHISNEGASYRTSQNPNLQETDVYQDNQYGRGSTYHTNQNNEGATYSKHSARAIYGAGARQLIEDTYHFCIQYNKKALEDPKIDEHRSYAEVVRSAGEMNYRPLSHEGTSKEIPMSEQTSKSSDHTPSKTISYTTTNMKTTAQSIENNIPQGQQNATINPRNLCKYHLWDLFKNCYPAISLIDSMLSHFFNVWSASVLDNSQQNASSDPSKQFNNHANTPIIRVSHSVGFLWAQVIDEMMRHHYANNQTHLGNLNVTPGIPKFEKLVKKMALTVKVDKKSGE